MKVLDSWGKQKLYIFLSPPPVQNNVPAPLTVPIADATHLFLIFLGPNTEYPSYATAGCERKGKKNLRY